MIPDTPSASVLTGHRFGAYDLHELIGAGGMGEVYRATDTILHRAVAVKVLPKPLRLDADRVARLRREAQMLAALNHPNIATIHGFELAPAGDWIAYGSNQTGKFEVYVERFPELGTRQMVSKGGGIEPVWAPSGKVIFYRSVDGGRMSQFENGAPTVRRGTRRPPGFRRP